jgi:gentisate 1,2-dioxygenase
MTKADWKKNVSYRDHITYTTEEIERRRGSRLHRSGVEVRQMLEEIDYRDPVAMVDPGIGFQVRSLRLFMQRIAPHTAEGPRKAGPSTWTKFGHRHTVEAVIYFLSSHGYSIIDGVRYDWRAGDYLCVPVFAWHRHVNEGDDPAVYVACVTVPFHKAIGLSVFEDELYPDEWIFAQKGDTALTSLVPGVAEGAPPPEGGNASGAEQLMRRELRFAHEEEVRRRGARVLLPAGEVKFEDTVLGRTSFIADPREGFNLKVLASQILELPAGGAIPVHRHAYEEIAYVQSGTAGASVIGDSLVEWTAGDTVYVPPLEWHQHLNRGTDAAHLLMHTNRPLTENIGLALTQLHPDEA